MDNTSKLPVIGTVLALVSHSVANWRALIVLSVLGGIVLQLSAQMMSTFVYVLAPMLGYATIIFAPMIWALPLLLSGFVHCVLAVLWHRLIILKEPVSSAGALQALSSRGYLLCAALLFGAWAAGTQAIMFVVVSVVAPQPATYYVLFLGFLAGFVMCAGRISLAFPAAALNAPEMNFRASFQATRGSTFRLLFGWVLAMIPLTVFQILLGWLFRSLGVMWFGNWVLQILGTSLVAASTIMSAGFVSFAYLHFKDAEAKRQTSAAHT